MSEQFVICTGCDKRIRPMRRYPFQPLADYLKMSPHASAMHVGLSGTTEKDARCHGLGRASLETIAGKIRVHPAEIWPEVIEHDIEDTSQQCADPQCANRFFPSNARQRYCSRRCVSRKWMRDTYHQRGEAERRRELYNTDPEYRERRVRDQRWRRRQGKAA